MKYVCLINRHKDHVYALVYCVYFNGQTDGAFYKNSWWRFYTAAGPLSSPVPHSYIQIGVFVCLQVVGCCYGSCPSFKWAALIPHEEGSATEICKHMVYYIKHKFHVRLTIYFLGGKCLGPQIQRNGHYLVTHKNDFYLKIKVRQICRDSNLSLLPTTKSFSAL